MTTASISSVVPAQVTQGAEYDVTLSGFATNWTDLAEVTFGDGITVTRTKAASPTSLVVHLRVAPDARADVRDVLVTQGTQTLRWTSAFTVLERVKFSALGTASQVSLSVVRLEVNEPGFELDTSPTGVSVATAPPLPVAVHQVSSKTLDVVVFASLDAGTGAYDLTVVSREGTLAERRFTGPQVLTVTPLQSTELVEGVPANGTIDRPFQSVTYRLAPDTPDAGVAAPLLVELVPGAQTVAPKVALLPASGVWPTSNLQFRGAMVLNPGPGDLYWLVVWDAAGNSGFQYTLEARRVARTIEEEPNDVFGQARVSTVPGIVGPMALSSLLDVDWVKVTAAAGDVGKVFHVVTLPGDPETDTLVEVFHADGTSPLGGESDDLDFHEDHRSAAIPAAGDYYVKVSLSPYVGLFDPAQSRYDLLITLE